MFSPTALSGQLKNGLILIANKSVTMNSKVEFFVVSRVRKLERRKQNETEE